MLRKTLISINTFINTDHYLTTKQKKRLKTNSRHKENVHLVYSLRNTHKYVQASNCWVESCRPQMIPQYLQMSKSWAIVRLAILLSSTVLTQHVNNLELHHHPHPSHPRTHASSFSKKIWKMTDILQQLINTMLLGVTKLNIKMKNHGDKFNRDLTWAWDSHA